MRKILGNSQIELSSKPRLERRPVDEIKPHPRHARKPNREQRRKLETSLRKFGENAPILVDRHGFILAGHARYEPLKALGRTHVWVLIIALPNESAAHRYLYAD